MEIRGTGMSWSIVQADAVDWLRQLPDDYADLCVTSPPYTGARTYGIKANRQPDEWVAWLRPIVVQMCRVARLVVLNVSDQVTNHRYGCADLWLVADLTRLDGLQLGPAPYAWVRNGVAGSGAKHYHRRNWEPVYVLARPENLPPRWSDNKAFGRPPKFDPGGEFSNRTKDGVRVNDPLANPPGSSRRASGDRKKTRAPRDQTNGDITHAESYTPPPIANPGNVIRTGNGGGQLGHRLAHENEAPMNLTLAERFVCWFCPPGGLLIDPFAGSGTTGHAALMHGRRFAGCDIRESQVALTRRRLESGIAPSLFG